MDSQGSSPAPAAGQNVSLAQARGGIPIRYIGDKPKKTDTITGSEVSWDGNGDVQYVPPAVAQKLLLPRYARIWQHAELTPPTKDLIAAQNAQQALRTVQAHVAKAALKPKPPQEPEIRVPLEDMIDAIISLMEEPDAEKNHLTATNSPKLESVRAKLGKKIGEAQLTEAWNAIQASAGS